MKGTGRPEPLRRIKAYRRHIDDANRRVYTGDEKQNPRVISGKGHWTCSITRLVISQN
ncbi:MAG: type II toxin-antitoxin system YoeB family toxin [Spirochaetaceae bacterium]|nr:type II toxin-antitoxin system YoeB family toxin [Spirochaetaceae bacterium]